MIFLKTKSGINWHYDVQGEGEPLLFVHGWGVDKRIWRQQTKFFSQYYKVISIDLPGHGQSSFEKVSLEVMVMDVVELLDHLAVSVVSIIGSSMGGLLALKFYELFPSRVRRLVFVGSMPKFARSHDYPHGLDVDRMRKLGHQLEQDYPSIVNVFFRSLFTKEERQSRRYKWLQRFRRDVAAPMQKALAEYLDILEHEDLREVLKTVHVPMQFINGTGDEICTMKTVEFIRQAVPHSRFDFFDKCGHFPFLSKPHEFNQLVDEFLKESTL